MKDHPDERNAGDDRHRPRHLTLHDPHHDAQLLRDLALINARTIAELGPLPPGGLPVEPKRNPEPLRPRAQAIQNTEEGQMKPIDVAAITVFGIAGALLAGCGQEAPQVPTKLDITEQTSRAEQFRTVGGMEISKDQQAKIVRQILESQYGEYDRGGQCWNTTLNTGDVSLDYCMRVGASVLFQTTRGQRLLFLTHNIQDSGHASGRYTYSHLDPGLVGMFAAELDANGNWSRIASSKAEPIGLNGDCGCADSQPVRIGKDLFGWILGYGDVAQGIVSSAFAVFAPIAGKFSVIAVMPNIEENRQDVSHQIMFDDSNADVEHYPLIFVEIQGGREIARRELHYDEREGRYPDIAPE